MVKELLPVESNLLHLVVKKYLRGEMVLGLQGYNVGHKAETNFGAYTIMDFLARVGNLGIRDGGRNIKGTVVHSVTENANAVALEPWWQKLYAGSKGRDFLIVHGQANNFSLQYKNKREALVNVSRAQHYFMIGLTPLNLNATNIEISRVIAFELFRG